MSKLKNVGIRMGKLIASLALAFGIMSSHSTCIAWYHQPKVPKNIDKF